MRRVPIFVRAGLFVKVFVLSVLLKIRLTRFILSSVVRKKSSLKLLTALLNDRETLELLSGSELSFIRWGDGETAILFKNDIPSQSYVYGLQCELINFVILPAFRGEFLLGIPWIVLYPKHPRYDINRVRANWVDTYWFLRLILRPELLYGDAFIFRPGSELTSHELSILWNGKHVILLSSDYRHVAYLESTSTPISIDHVLCSSANSYKEADALLKRIRHIAKVGAKSTRILISAGVAGKIIGARLIHDGFIVYDVGHYFTWKARSLSNDKRL